MPYRYLDHIGDAAIEATGDTLEEAFAEMAMGMFGLMVRAARLVPDRTVEISAMGQTHEDLLVSFLNELLAQQGLQDCVFIDCAVRGIVPSRSGGYVLSGIARGVAPEKAEGRLGPEVKAASYAGLRIEEGEKGFVIRCVLDL
ncbi:MAG: archease [Candidatus Aureabacteria bacterium]|nr:archease [Candidatus Auribacterota bacterium]